MRCSAPFAKVVDNVLGADAKGFLAMQCTSHPDCGISSFLLVNQYGAFNSPVWFNVGHELHPQCSACFINSVQDTMDSILTLAKTEGMLFKYGSSP